LLGNARIFFHHILLSALSRTLLRRVGDRIFEHPLENPAYGEGDRGGHYRANRTFLQRPNELLTLQPPRLTRDYVC
jgi:hypothetical protein